MINTRATFIAFIMLLILASCWRDSGAEWEARKKEQRKENAARRAALQEREEMVTAAYAIADTNLMSSIALIDSLIQHDTGRDSYHRDWMFIKGDIYNNADSLERALAAYNDYLSSYPRSGGYAGRASVYTKMREYEKAYNDLYKSLEHDYDCHWNIGNYFEIVKKKDSAIAHYKKMLYGRDTIFYRLGMERLNELGRPTPKYLTEIKIRRERTMILMIEPVDNPVIDKFMRDGEF